MQDEGENKIVVFLASVIDHRNRFLRMVQMLDSVRLQHTKPDIFCISIFIDKEAVDVDRAEIAKLFSNLTHRNATVHVVLQKNRKPQFVQFEELLKKFTSSWYPEKSHVWVTFTDDDDLWHANRIRMFSYALSQVHLQAHPVSGCNVSEDNTHDQPGCCNVKTPDDVDKAYACGCAEQSILPTDNRVEYHRCIVPLWLMLAFFEKYPFYVQTNRYIDMLFSTYIHSYGKGAWKHITIQPEDGAWSYFYRNGQHEYPCVTAPLGDNLKGFEGVCERTVEQLEIPSMGAKALYCLSVTLNSAIGCGNAKHMLHLIVLRAREKREKIAAKYGVQLIKVPELANLNHLLNTSEQEFDANWKRRYYSFFSK